MREIDIPLVRGDVRTLAHVAHVAQIAVVYDVPIEFFGNAVHFHGVRLVDRVEQCREGVAEIEAAAAAVTDVKDALELGVERRVVVELVALPVNRMTSRRFEAALASVFRVTH